MRVLRGGRLDDDVVELPISAAVSATKKARVTPTCIGSKRLPCASTADL